MLAIPEIARADLDKAIAYAEVGEKDKAHKELLLIAETALTLYNANELDNY